MTLRLLGVALVAALVPIAPAHADEEATDFRMSAVPCGATCSDWVDDANSDLDGDGNPEVYFQACEAPFPATGFDQISITPTRSGLLVIKTYPTVDWDTYVCASSGAEVAILGEQLDDCSAPLVAGSDIVSVGCSERIAMTAFLGHTLVIRSFNFSDPFDLRGTYQIL